MPYMQMNIYTSNPDADLRFLVELADGRCLVSCHGQNAVLIVDAEGNVTGKIEGVEFARPEGIAIDTKQKGRVLVVDRFNHCIHAFDGQSLAPVARIGSRGSGDAEFNQPVGIAVSAVDGRIWIADNENHRVQALDSSGAFSTVLGAGRLFCPCGIALVNHAQHGELVVVSEWGGGRVQVFKTNGDVFAIFPGVQHAHHVVVEEGVVLVSEYATRKIKRFSLEGEDTEMTSSAVVSIGSEWLVMRDRVERRPKSLKRARPSGCDFIESNRT